MRKTIWFALLLAGHFVAPPASIACSGYGCFYNCQSLPYQACLECFDTGIEACVEDCMPPDAVGGGPPSPNCWGRCFSYYQAKYTDCVADPLLSGLYATPMQAVVAAASIAVPSDAALEASPVAAVAGCTSWSIQVISVSTALDASAACNLFLIAPISSAPLVVTLPLLGDGLDIRFARVGGVDTAVVTITTPDAYPIHGHVGPITVGIRSTISLLSTLLPSPNAQGWWAYNLDRITIQ